MRSAGELNDIQRAVLWYDQFMMRHWPLYSMVVNGFYDDHKTSTEIGNEISLGTAGCSGENPNADGDADVDADGDVDVDNEADGDADAVPDAEGDAEADPCSLREASVRDHLDSSELGVLRDTETNSAWLEDDQFLRLSERLDICQVPGEGNLVCESFATWAPQRQTLDSEYNPSTIRDVVPIQGVDISRGAVHRLAILYRTEWNSCADGTMDCLDAPLNGIMIINRDTGELLQDVAFSDIRIGSGSEVQLVSTENPADVALVDETPIDCEEYNPGCNRTRLMLTVNQDFGAPIISFVYDPEYGLIDVDSLRRSDLNFDLIGGGLRAGGMHADDGSSNFWVVDGVESGDIEAHSWNGETVEIGERGEDAVRYGTMMIYEFDTNSDSDISYHVEAEKVNIAVGSGALYSGYPVTGGFTSFTRFTANRDGWPYESTDTGGPEGDPLPSINLSTATIDRSARELNVRDNVTVVFHDRTIFRVDLANGIVSSTEVPAEYGQIASVNRNSEGVIFATTTDGYLCAFDESMTIIDVDEVAEGAQCRYVARRFGGVDTATGTEINPEITFLGDGTVLMTGAETCMGGNGVVTISPGAF